MSKLFTLIFICLLLPGPPAKPYPWLKSYTPAATIGNRIKTPSGFERVEVKAGSFAEWLRNFPLLPVNTPVKLYNGELKYTQEVHCAVADLDFIGKNLQQCIDAIIRLRAEYLRSAGRENEIQFSYSCCGEKIKWSKWKKGWRTKIVTDKGRSTFAWIKAKAADSSETTFRSYLYNVMNYAGTLSLSRNMKTIEASNVEIGDAFVHGAAPGSGHGVIIMDMARSSSGKKLMLLGQSFNPAENFNILKSGGKYSPWFEVDFGESLITPQWIFSKEHARRFE